MNKNKQQKHKNIKNQPLGFLSSKTQKLMAVTGSVMVVASALVITFMSMQGGNFSNSNNQLIANASDPEANLIIGQVDRGGVIDLSVCLQSTGVDFRLADASTWFDFDGTSLTPISGLHHTGRFSSGNGYGAADFQSVNDTSTTDTWSVRVDYTGDGVTPGSEGLTVTSTESELIGSAKLTKVGSNNTLSLNTSGTAYYSVENGSTPVDLNVVNVNYDCHSTLITQTNIDNSTNCTNTYDVTVPATYNCTLPLIGNLFNLYRTDSTILAATGLDNTTTDVLVGSQSDACVITGYDTSAVALQCDNIKTVGSGSSGNDYSEEGIKNVLVTLDNTTYYDRGDVNILLDEAFVNVKMFLAGAYNSATSNMRTNLRANDSVPLTQPYNTSPWNYSGTESVTSFTSSDIVDWVLVEVYNPANTLVQRRAALLRNDGQVLDYTTQTPGVLFDNINSEGDYKVVVKHRNHLAVATDTDVFLVPGNNTTPVDFSTNANVLSANQTMITTGVYGLRAGNTNGDGQIIAGDRVAARTGSEAAFIYFARDLNLDGIVNSTDRTVSRLATESFEVLGLE